MRILTNSLSTAIETYSNPKQHGKQCKFAASIEGCLEVLVTDSEIKAWGGTKAAFDIHKLGKESSALSLYIDAGRDELKQEVPRGIVAIPKWRSAHVDWSGQAQGWVVRLEAAQWEAKEEL